MTIHGPFELPKLLNFYFNSDPGTEPAFPCNVDPDQASRNNADP